MEALRLVEQWPVPNVSAAVVHGRSGPEPPPGGAPDHALHEVFHGDPRRRYRLASISKPLTAWATLVAVEEGIVDLDDAVGQPGCTLRHLLSHAGGYGFDGAEPITGVGRRRIYSNTGIELAAAHVAGAAGMPFAQYLAEAVFEPLGMTATELRGSPAYAIWSDVADLVRFVHEVIAPRLVHPATAASATSPVFGGLRGVVPGIGSFDDCVWGLGFEIRGDKSPHWTGRRNSPRAFGHFGGAGTLLWVDPGAVHDRVVACVALTDRPFDEWADEALRVWPVFSDAVVDELRSDGPQHTAVGAPR